MSSYWVLGLVDREPGGRRSLKVVGIPGGQRKQDIRDILQEIWSLPTRSWRKLKKHVMWETVCWKPPGGGPADSQLVCRDTYFWPRAGLGPRREQYIPQQRHGMLGLSQQTCTMPGTQSWGCVSGHMTSSPPIRTQGHGAHGEHHPEEAQHHLDTTQVEPLLSGDQAKSPMSTIRPLMSTWHRMRSGLWD